jgi:hypothetical protein
MDTQFIEQVKRVLVHGALPTHTGSYFNISLEQAQLEVRIGSPLLEANYDDYGFLLTFCWVKVLWQFLWMHRVTLHNSDQVLPKLQRQGDFFIMEHIVASQGFLEEDILRTNHCRLAFRAMTAADILTGDGIKVTKMPLISDDCHGHLVYGTGPTRTPQIRIFPAGSQVCNELRWQTSASLSPYDWNAGLSNHILGGNGSTGDMSVIFSTTQMGCGIIMSPFLPA